MLAVFGGSPLKQYTNGVASKQALLQRFLGFVHFPNALRLSENNSLQPPKRNKETLLSDGGQKIGSGLAKDPPKKNQATLNTLNAKLPSPMKKKK